jgi:hypothetical protein
MKAPLTPAPTTTTSVRSESFRGNWRKRFPVAQTDTPPRSVFFVVAEAVLWVMALKTRERATRFTGLRVASSSKENAYQSRSTL